MKRQKWLFLTKNLLPFFLDFVILIGVAFWYAFGNIPVILLVTLILTFLLHWKKTSRFLLTKILYCIIAVLLIDMISLTLYPLYHISKGLYVAFWLLLVLSLYLTHKYKNIIGVNYLHSLMFPFAIVFTTLFLGNEPPNKEYCKSINKDPATEWLIKLPSSSHIERGIPRFLIKSPNKGNFIVTYRATMAHAYKYWADQFNMRELTLNPLPMPSEAIGIYSDMERKKIYSVNVEPGNRKQPKYLMVFNDDGTIDRTLKFPSGGENDYEAFFVPKEDTYWILSKDRLTIFDPVTYSFHEKTYPFSYAEGCRGFGLSNFIYYPPSDIYVSRGLGPIVQKLLAFDHVCGFNIERFKLFGRFRAPKSVGVFDIALAPDREEILCSSGWKDEIWVVSSKTLEYKRTLRIAPCVRSVAYDPYRKLGYTATEFSGEFIIFDVTSGKILGKAFIGKGSRKIYVFEEEGVIVLSGCGIIRVHPEIILAHAVNP